MMLNVRKTVFFIVQDPTFGIDKTNTEYVKLRLGAGEKEKFYCNAFFRGEDLEKLRNSHKGQSLVLSGTLKIERYNDTQTFELLNGVVDCLFD